MSLPQPHAAPVILVVEDEVLIRLVIADTLRDCGWRVIEAGSADEAVTVLEAADVAIDVVFSDIETPGKLDGFGLARWVRERHPGIRVLLTSGGVAARASGAGDLRADAPPAVLAKPYHEREVVRRIGAMLGRAERGKA